MLYFTRWKALGIVLTALIVCLFAVPNFFSETTTKNWPVWAQRRIALGIDLQGGSSLVLEVDSNYVRQQMLRQTLDDARATLREAGISHPKSSIKGDAVEVRVREADLPTALVKLRELAQQLREFEGSNSQLEIAEAGGGLIRLSVPEAAVTEQLPRIIERSIQMVEKRINELGTVKPIVQRYGADRILVEIPGLQHPNGLKPIRSGGDARLEFRMVDTSVSPDQAQQGELPPDSELLTSASAPKTYVIKKQVLVSSYDIVDAQPGFDPRTNEPVVNVKFNMSGARRFARARAENMGSPFAIVLGGQVISAPLSFEPVTRGQGQLSGNFTVESAKELVVWLLAGGPPVPLTVVKEGTIGRGQNSVESSNPTARPSPQPSHRD